MKRYTERLQVALPIERKRKLVEEARAMGISLSELMRRKIDRYISEDSAWSSAS